MNIFTITFFNLLMMFALTVPGIVCNKLKIFSGNAVKDMSNMLLYIGMPFLIFSNMGGISLDDISWLPIVVCVSLAIFIQVFGVLVVFLVYKNDTDLAKKRVCALAAGFANCGFLGIPIASSIVPEEIKSEVMLYVALYNVVFCFLSWIVGSMIFRTEERKENALLNGLLNPCAIGFYIALVFVFFGINVNEIEYVGSFISYLSGLCAPVSMIVLGLRIPNINIKKMLTTGKLYASVIVRLIISPLVACGILALLRIWCGIGDAVILGVAIMAAMPCAATVISFSEKYDADSLLASETVIMSTTLSIITVPLMVTLASLILLL